MDENKIFKKNQDVVTRKIAGEVILLPIYRTSKDMSYIYSLNKTAAAAWELIDGKNTLGKIRDKLTQAYDAGKGKIAKQLDELINDLKLIKAIS